MNKELLLKQANDYLKKEKNSFFKDDLQKVIDAQDWDELNDRFYTSLAFGTGGLRGVIGGGLNRLNPYNISKAAQGMANYIIKNTSGSKTAVIAYDSRLYSDLLSKSVALVLAANGIKTWLFSSLRPTPELSYAIRKLGCVTGAVVTASHNPQEYNGFKVYWSNGAQVIVPHDTGIIDQVNQVKEIKMMDEETALKEGMLEYIDKEIDDAFVKMIKGYSLRPEIIKEQAKNTSIVYTPLNGTGLMLVERILSEMGISVSTVPQQAQPDGTFPTCPFPNPEIAETMQLALDLGTKKKADLVMGTDPDADRLGIAVPDGDKWKLITGNQLGAMLTYYLLSTLKEFNRLPDRAAVVKTIVTTGLTKLIAKDFGVSCRDCLTGFKWIADVMEQLEESGEQFIIGYEESYGFLMETEVRDKDAVGAAAMTAEMALYCHSKGHSLIDYLNEIYSKYGYFEEFQIAKTFKGESGLKVMASLMEEIRLNPLTEVGGSRTILFRDYLTQVEHNLIAEENNNIDLPKSNVLQFELEDGSIFTVRPSGTEPKIKFYGSCCSPSEMKLDVGKALVSDKVIQIKAFVNSILKNY